MPRAMGEVDHRKTIALLDAAEAVICHEGAPASLGHIARAAGVSKQTLYNRFGGRAGFFAALAAHQATRCPPPVIEQQLRRTTSEAVQTYVSELLAYLDRPLHRELLAPRSVETRTSGAIWRRDVLGRARNDLAGWFDQQTRAGRLHIADPEAMAALLIQLCVAQTIAPVCARGALKPSAAAKRALVLQVIGAVLCEAADRPTPRRRVLCTPSL